MIEYVVYYGESGERYIPTDYTDRREKLPQGAKWGFPDEIKILGIPLIKREKTLAEMNDRDWKGWGPDGIFYAAKDISLARAEVYH